MTSKPSAGQALLATVVLACAYIGGLVGLQLEHLSTDTLTQFAGPALAGLFTYTGVSVLTGHQNDVLSRIDKNTNGALDSRIISGVNAVLTQHGIPDVVKAALGNVAAASTTTTAAPVTVNVAPRAAPQADAPASVEVPAEAPDVNAGSDVADPAQLPPVSGDVLPDPHAAAVSPEVLAQALAQLVAAQQPAAATA